MEYVSVNRCFKTQGFGTVQNAQLHIFSDGSELGYGACAYLKPVDDGGNILCSLVIEKSKLDQVTFWTDSMIVLGYIKNVSRRFKISVIHGVSSLGQWCHIESHMNPADIASRSTIASDKDSFSVWLYGPTFIWRYSVHWPKKQLPHEVAEDHVEVKEKIVINAITQCFFDSMVDYYSD